MTSPYYQDDKVTLYLGDCREVSDWLSADILVTDPPYGRDWKQGEFNGGRASKGIANDASTEMRDLALELWGSGKPALVFGDLLLPAPSGARQVGVFKKPADAGARGAFANMRRDIEAVYIVGPWKAGIGGTSSVLTTGERSLVGYTRKQYPRDRGTGHPHTKPLDLMEGLVQRCPPGVIADPFAGSGSTLVAARNLGRRAVGVEMDEAYCEIAARRLAQDCFDFGEAS